MDDQCPKCGSIIIINIYGNGQCERCNHTIRNKKPTNDEGYYYVPYLPMDCICMCQKVVEPKWRKGRKRKRSPKKTSIVNYTHKINYIGSDTLKDQKITFDEV